MKIAFVSYKYNWTSFSIIKSMFDILGEIHDVRWYDMVYKDDDFSADIIWNVGYKTKAIKTGVFTVNFGLSDPAKYLAEKTENCDLYCTNDFALQKKNPSFYHFPCFCDQRYHQPKGGEKHIPVLFFGNRNHSRIPWRGDYVDMIRKSGITVKAFGDGWGCHKDDGGFISGANMLQIINQAEICLDIASDTSSLAHRLFEASCCGVPVITKEREDVAALFVPGEEIITYTDANDLLDKIKYYLNHKEELQEIGQRARKRCVLNHDVYYRIKGFLKHLQENYENIIS